MVQFLGYCATHPNGVTRYHESDIILIGHNDASYLSKSKSRIRAGEHFYMGSRDYNNTQETNGAVLTVSIFMKNYMSLVAEAEVEALFHNCQEDEPLRVTFK